MAGFIGLALLIGVTLLAPFSLPTTRAARTCPTTSSRPLWEEGDAHHLFGTDPLGRDLPSRLIYGARYSLMISIGASSSVASSASRRLVAGFFGGLTDTVLMRLGDIQLAFPFVLFAIAVLGVSRANTAHLILVLGIPSWIIYARVVRSRVLSEREKDYALAAGRWALSRRLFRYIVPNVWQVVPLDRLARPRLPGHRRVAAELPRARAPPADPRGGRSWPTAGRTC